MWGTGIYFAEKASYSNNYAHVTEDDLKQMFLTIVITGDSFNSPPNKNFKLPPQR
jgi:hypothetical protein